ncbi:MAG: acyltransferase family protein [Spirochaetales bacterium]|nr:acyltransferase family protein [Spirochaetales bacterium]
MDRIYMASQDNKPEREIWIDLVKFIACLFVALGHLFQSFHKSSIIPDSILYNYFNTAIYHFHVPLFFFCSGYLHQMHIKKGLVAYGNNILKKLINLGVPYFTFSSITILMKFLFSGLVNSPISDNIIDALFLNPLAPYWFLYTLFFIFLITPRLTGHWKIGVFLCVAIALKILCYYFNNMPFVITGVMANLIWFAMGMFIQNFKCQFIKTLKLALPVIILFIISSYVSFMFRLDDTPTSILLTIIGGSGIIFLSLAITKTGKFHKIIIITSKYTMPIFLLHTISAAPIRILFITMGVRDITVHILFGLIFSFMVPVLVAYVSEKTILLNIFFQPVKTFRHITGQLKH